MRLVVVIHRRRQLAEAAQAGLQRVDAVDELQRQRDAGEIDAEVALQPPRLLDAHDAGRGKAPLRAARPEGSITPSWTSSMTHSAWTRQVRVSSASVISVVSSSSSPVCDAGFLAGMAYTPRPARGLKGSSRSIC